MLRDYQEKTVNDAFSWMSYYQGNLCINLPTGAGKSYVIAEICRRVIGKYHDKRILMLTHQKELILQDYEKLLHLWPNAPAGIYSASLKLRDIEAITFAGIMSIRNKIDDLGIIDMIIVDEAHTISHKDEGSYRNVINLLKEKNGKIRVVGLTASPYRMGHGLITDKPAIFDEMIEPVTIVDLQKRGFLADLISKTTDEKIRADGVNKRGGEYIESQLQKVVDTRDHNEKVVDEIIAKSKGRESWLVFCSGVDHAEHIRDLMQERGITAECITGKTNSGDRDRCIEQYKSGKINCLTNANVLTTGFDAPNTDLIALVRPTCSPGLYIQMVGRGLRVKEHIDNCLVLDFAGVIEMHGPITMIKPPGKKKGEGEGVAPCKVCPECDEIVHASIRNCPRCGYEFPKQEAKYTLRNDDIMGRDKMKTFDVDFWTWEIVKSKRTQKDMIKVTYCSSLLDRMSEYLCVWHEGYAGRKGKEILASIMQKSLPLEQTTEALQQSKPPAKLEYYMDGKFPRVVDRIWEYDDEIPF